MKGHVYNGYLVVVVGWRNLEHLELATRTTRWINESGIRDDRPTGEQHLKKYAR
jgi:hypothetical protein